jgi:glycine cleavage system H lipoate-binding protein
MIATSLHGIPELVDADPYGHGWIFDVDAELPVQDPQLACLIHAHAYCDLAGA